MRRYILNNYQFKSIIFDNEYINKINNLITRAWKYDYGIEGFLKYDPDHFRWLVSSPDFDPELAIGAFTKKGELVGFNAVFPARFKWRAVSCKSGISTYLSIDPEHRKKGIARNLIIETINRSVKNKYEILLANFDFKFSGKKVFNSALRTGVRKGLNMKLIKKGDWYCKILDFEKFKNSIGIDVPMKQMLEGYRLDGFKSCIKDDPNCILKRIGTKFLKTSLNIPEQTSEADKAGKSINEHVMNVNDIDKNGLLELYNDYWSSIEFVQTWSEAELKWYMNNTKIKTLVFKWGKLGALTYYIKTIESKKSFKIAWIDNGNINDLSPREQLGLVNILLSRAKDDGCVIAVLPRLGYLDKKPFIQSGFIPYPRKFEIHGVILSSQLDDIIQLKRIYSVIR